MKQLESHTKSQMGFTLIDQSAKRGFTLIELSIVLVIIGLIVGGVLVGQDLIRAAEIRATVSQLEKYNSAVNTFRSKYNGIPGDIRCDYRFSFGFNGGETPSCTGMTGAAGLADGNGLLESGAGSASDLTKWTGELIGFWSDLSVGNLVDGSFGGNAAAATYLNQAAVVPTAAVTSATMPQWLPPAKLGRGNYVLALSPGANLANGPQQGFNYFIITGMTGISATGVYTTAASLTPIEARNIDAKIDDGQPFTGNVLAGDAATATNAFNVSGNAAGKCVGNVTAGTYSVDATQGVIQSCTLAARFN